MSSFYDRFPDKVLLFLVATLVVIGLFVFTSASFGLLTREGAGWGNVLFSQMVLGLGGGLILGLIAYVVPLNTWRKYSFYIFILALLACLLVFVPGIGFEAGGAARWILIAGVSFQPSEFLKLALLLVLASWGAATGAEINSFRYGLLPFLVFIGTTGALLLAQPDTGTFIVMFSSAMAIFLVAGGRIKHIMIMLGAGCFLILFLAMLRPYVMERIVTFLNPSDDPLGDAYQIRQSLLAIGSGRLVGRGFGQSVQKFQYLPEPTGDSIFAVLGEEFGFLGTAIVTLLFLSFCLRGLRIGGRAPTRFGRLLTAGIVIMITAQAFLHIGAMVGVLPLTGIPLPLVSHGGSALMFNLAAIGILLQISRYRVAVQKK